MIRPSVAVEPPWRSEAARSLRSKPSCAIASVTRSAVAGVTPASALITRETVFRLTPAVCATSLIVGLMTTLSCAWADASRRRHLCQGPPHEPVRDHPLRRRGPDRDDHPQPPRPAQHDRPADARRGRGGRRPGGRRPRRQGDRAARRRPLVLRGLRLRRRLQGLGRADHERRRVGPGQGLRVRDGAADRADAEAHERLALSEAGDRAGPRMVRRAAAATSRSAPTSSSPRRTRRSARPTRACGAPTCRGCGSTASVSRAPSCTR